MAADWRKRPVAVRSAAHAWRLIDEYVTDRMASGLMLDSGWPGEPLLVTDPPHGAGVRFDAAKIDHVLEFFALLRQIKGEWAGRVFRLLDWQVRWEIAPMFGFVSTAGFRIIRTAWIEKPRKNGKSTECSGIGLLLFTADREPGAEVYAAASSKDQATIVFTPAKLMAEASPEILRRLTRAGIQRRLLEHPVTHSIFRPLASDMAGEGRLQGLNVHGSVVDEVHVHKTPDTIDALETGTGSRRQPLIVFITTADEGVTGSVYDVKREYVEQLVSGAITDRSWYAVVFAAPPEMVADDPYGDDTIVAANPGVGFTVQMDYLRQKANEARKSPRQTNRYLRLHLGQRVRQEVRWFNLKAWDRAGPELCTCRRCDEREGPWPAGPFTAEGFEAVCDQFVGLDSWGGLDLSSTVDLTAFSLLGVPDQEDLSTGVDLASLVWLPYDRAADLEKTLRVPIGEWERWGWVRLTEGNVVDYRTVREDIVELVYESRCYFREAGYDPWAATQVVLELGDEGVATAKVNQTYAGLSAGAKELERLVVGSTRRRPLVRHHRNPVLRWMADSVQVQSDTGGNIKPVKPDRSKSVARIDGVAAAVNAMARFVARPELEGADDEVAGRVR